MRFAHVKLSSLQTSELSTSLRALKLPFFSLSLCFALSAIRIHTHTHIRSNSCCGRLARSRVYSGPRLPPAGEEWHGDATVRETMHEITLAPVLRPQPTAPSRDHLCVPAMRTGRLVRLGAVSPNRALDLRDVSAQARDPHAWTFRFTHFTSALQTQNWRTVKRCYSSSS